MILYSNDTRIRKQVREALAPLTVTVKKVSVTDYPKRADAIVTCGVLGHDTSMLEIQLGARVPIVLPEGGQWLSDQAKAGKLKVLAGVDIARL